MKYLIISLLVFLYDAVTAQIPPKPREIRGDMDIPVPALSEKTGERGAGYYQKDGKYGFVYPESVKQAAIYDYINFSSNGFIIKKGELYGIADKKGNILGDIKYDSVATIYGSSYIVKKNGKYGTITNAGNKILSIKYDKILLANELVSFVQTRGGYVQMIFNEQEQIFTPNIEQAILYANVTVIKANGKFGVVNKRLVVPNSYDSIFVSGIQPSMSTVSMSAARSSQVAKKYSLIDKSNSYKTVSCLTLQKDNKYGLVDIDGNVIYAPDNDAVYNQEVYGFYTIKKNNLYGIYFTRSKEKTAIEFDKVYADGVGYVMATKNQKAGAFNLQGKQIVAFDYDPEFIMQYNFGLRVTKNKKRGIVGKDGAILIPPLYDDVDPFYESALRDLVRVKLNEKFGIVNLQGKMIIPVEYEWIGEEKGLLKVVTADKRFGLYDKTGKVVIPAQYRWIVDSDTENSNIIILRKDINSFNFYSKNSKQVLLKENVNGHGYIHDQDGLLNPFSSSNKYLMFVKGKNGKIGMLNEITGTLDIPMIYDDIIQRFDEGKHVYFSVRNGKKYGLIDENNKLVIPLQYDAISINLMYSGAGRQPDAVVVARGNKFGAVSLENKTLIPFQYADLQRISRTGLYKARVGANYQIINIKNEVIGKGPFDEVANFEAAAGADARTGLYKSRGATNSKINEKSDIQHQPGYQALTFYKGKMRVVDDKGNYTTTEIPMHPHHGYKTFEEMKMALIKALDSKDDALLKDFAAKVSPSEHILFYLKENPSTRQSLQYIDVNAIREKYYKDLLDFKNNRWNQSSNFAYNRASLTDVADYTMYQRGLVTNVRRIDHAFGDTRFMEKVLRNAFKINGYWISSYFMSRGFDRY